MAALNEALLAVAHEDPPPPPAANSPKGAPLEPRQSGHGALGATTSRPAAAYSSTYCGPVGWDHLRQLTESLRGPHEFAVGSASSMGSPFRQ